MNFHVYLYSLARILPPPEVKYRGKGNIEVAEHVAVGKWAIRNRFYHSPAINKWGILYFGPKPQNQIISILQEFESQLPQVSVNEATSSDQIQISFPYITAISTVWCSIQLETDDYG